MPNPVSRFAAAFGGALALTALATGAVMAQDNSLPDGPPKALVENTCSLCHSTDVITQKRRSPEEWQDIVTRMEGMGAMLDADQEKTVVAYLSANLGASGGAASASAQTTAPSSQPGTMPMP